MQRRLNAGSTSRLTAMYGLCYEGSDAGVAALWIWTVLLSHAASRMSVLRASDEHAHGLPASQPSKPEGAHRQAACHQALFARPKPVVVAIVAPWSPSRCRTSALTHSRSSAATHLPSYLLCEYRPDTTTLPGSDRFILPLSESTSKRMLP